MRLLTLLFGLLLTLPSFGQRTAVYFNGKVVNQFVTTEDTTHFVTINGAQRVKGIKTFSTFKTKQALKFKNMQIGYYKNTGNLMLAGLNSFKFNGNGTLSPGNLNIALGEYTLEANDKGWYNYAAGYYSLNAATEASFNTALGAGSMALNSLGSHNISLGYQSSYKHNSNDNLAIGRWSLAFLLTGNRNIVIGTNSDVGSVTFISANGYNAANSMNIGNIIFGNNMNGNWNSPAGNIGIGVNNPSYKLQVKGSIRSNQTITSSSYASRTNKSSNKLFMSDGSIKQYSFDNVGSYNGLGTSNPTALLDINSTNYLGNDAVRLINDNNSVNTHLSSPAGTWCVVDFNRNGNEQWSMGMPNLSENLYIKYSNNNIGAHVGIDDSAPTELLSINGNISVSGRFHAGVRSIISSDIRLKTNLQPLQNALKSIQQLKPFAYDKKTSLTDTRYSFHEYGFIAQDIQKIYPFLVHTGKDKNHLLSVNYVAFIPVLTKAIQELKQQSDNSDAQLIQLQKQMNNQQKDWQMRLERLQKMCD